MKPSGENPGGENRWNIPALREIIEERKEKAVESLSVSFARNRLPLEEYERLVEYINKIESERELIIVEKIVAEYDKNGAPDSAETNPEKADDEGRPDYSGHPRSGADSFRPFGRMVYPFRSGHFSSDVNLALLSSRTVRGPLKQGSAFVSILGSNRIEIRKADLAGPRTDIEVAVILGDCVIFVEPGIRVFNKTIPILGDSTVDRGAAKQAGEGEPELFISGAALLGNVTVKRLEDL